MSAATVLPYIPGQNYPDKGGIYAGLVFGAAGQPSWHLFVPTDPAAEFTDIAWGGYGHKEPAAESFTDGVANTAALIASSADHPAARACAALTLAGHSDFYLPSRHELQLCYAYAAESFNKDDWYWSSTQYAGNSYDAWNQHFYGGYQDFNDKYSQGRARAVRRELVI